MSTYDKNTNRLSFVTARLQALVKFRPKCEVSLSYRYRLLIAFLSPNCANISPGGGGGVKSPII